MTGICERAVISVRRLVALVAESDAGEVIRDALVGELRGVLELESVTVVRCDQGETARDAGGAHRGGCI